jgi:hypothetical protein
MLAMLRYDPGSTIDVIPQLFQLEQALSNRSRQRSSGPLLLWFSATDNFRA